MLPLPGQVFHAVLPPLGKLFDQHLLFKRGLAGKCHGPGQLLRVRHLADATAAGAVGGLDDHRVRKRQGVQIRVFRHQDAFARRQACLFKGKAHQVLVGGVDCAFHAVAHKAQPLGDKIDRDGGKVGGDGTHAHRSDSAADFQDALLLHDAHRVEVIRRLLAHIAALPGEDMGNVPHGLCPEDELVLKIIGADNGDGWFHSDSCNQFGVWSVEFGVWSEGAASPRSYLAPPSLELLEYN